MTFLGLTSGALLRADLVGLIRQTDEGVVVFLADDMRGDGYRLHPELTLDDAARAVAAACAEQSGAIPVQLGTDGP